MIAKRSVDRRGFLARGLAIAGASLLGGCDSGLSDQPWVKRILDSAEALTRCQPTHHVLPPTLIASAHRITLRGPHQWSFASQSLR